MLFIGGGGEKFAKESLLGRFSWSGENEKILEVFATLIENWNPFKIRRFKDRLKILLLGIVSKIKRI